MILYLREKNNFEIELNKIYNDAEQNNKNIPIQISALYNIYFNLSMEQQDKLAESFYLIIKNI